MILCWVSSRLANLPERDRPTHIILTESTWIARAMVTFVQPVELGDHGNERSLNCYRKLQSIIASHTTHS